MTPPSSNMSEKTTQIKAALYSAAGLVLLLAIMLLVADNNTNKRNNTSNDITYSLATHSRIGDEIKTHVLEECALYTLYKKNRNEFDPIEVGVHIQPEIYKEKVELIEPTKDRIYQVVKDQQSFYRRSMIYNVYYRVCLGLLDYEEAGRLIPDLMSRAIPNAPIQAADDTIRKLISTYSNDERTERDRNKIKVLTFVEGQETDRLVKKKEQSVIRELEHDIELWEWL